MFTGTYYYRYTSQDFLLWTSACPFLLVKGSLRAVGFAVTPASLLRGWDQQDSEKSPSLQLAEGGILWDVLGRHPPLIHRSRVITSGVAPTLILAVDWSSRRRSWAV